MAAGRFVSRLMCPVQSGQWAKRRSRPQWSESCVTPSASQKRRGNRDFITVACTEDVGRMFPPRSLGLFPRGLKSLER